MIRRNSRGDIIESRRTIDTSISGKLLVGDGWEAVAHTELKRLSIAVGIYQQQLEDYAGYEELTVAKDALNRACAKIAESVEAFEDDRRFRD